MTGGGPAESVQWVAEADSDHIIFLRRKRKMKGGCFREIKGTVLILKWKSNMSS